MLQNKTPDPIRYVSETVQNAFIGSVVSWVQRVLLDRVCARKICGAEISLIG